MKRVGSLPQAKEEPIADYAVQKRLDEEEQVTRVRPSNTQDYQTRDGRSQYTSEEN